MIAERTVICRAVSRRCGIVIALARLDNGALYALAPPDWAWTLIDHSPPAPRQNGKSWPHPPSA